MAQGWSAAEAAKQLSASGATAYKWLRRYRAEGKWGSSTVRAAHTTRRGAWPTTTENWQRASQSE